MTLLLAVFGTFCIFSALVLNDEINDDVAVVLFGAFCGAALAFVTFFSLFA